MIQLFDQWAETFAGLGLGVLNPVSCTVSEEAGGEYTLEMDYPLDNEGLWKRITPLRIIVAPVPVCDTPPIDASGDITVGMEIWAVSAANTEMFPSIPVQTNWISNHKYYQGNRVIYNYYFYNCANPPKQPDGVYSQTAGFNTDGAWSKMYRAVNPVAKLNTGTLLYVSANASGYLRCRLASGTGGYVSNSRAHYVRTATQEDIDNMNAGARMIQTQAFRITDVEVDTEAGLLHVNAQHISYDYASQYVGNLDLNGDTLTNAVLLIQSAVIPNGEGAPIIHCEDGDLTITGSYTTKTTVEALLDPEIGLVSQAHCRLVRDNLEFFLLPNEATDRGYRITWGVNLKGVKWKRDVSKLATRVIPFGKQANGRNLYLLTPFYVASERDGQYAIPAYEMLQVDVRVGGETPDGGTYTNETAREVLAAEGQKRFDEDHVDLPVITVEVDFVMLGTTEEYAALRGLERVSLYDQVTVFCPDLGIDVSAQVKSYSWDAIRERYNKITLGDVFDHKIGTVSGYDVRGTALDISKITPHTIAELSAIINH